MSMLQTAQFLRPAPFVSDLPNNGGKAIFVFIYDHHYDWTEFQRSFPSSHNAGLAKLPNWTWHINAEGKPNIRRAFIEQSSSLSATQQYVLPAHARRISIPRCPHLCSYGHVLRLPLSDDKKLQDILGRGRIRMVQTVEVTVSQNPGRMGKVPAIIYYDPRNTCDLRHSIVKTDAERIAWNNGLNLLRFAGAPYWYTQKVTKHLNAFMEDVEPLLVCPVQLAVQPLDLRDAEADDESVVLEGRNASGSNRRGSESLPMRGARNGRLEAAGLTLPTVRNVKRARNPCGDEGRAQPRKRLRKLSIGSTSRRRSGT